MVLPTSLVPEYVLQPATDSQQQQILLYSFVLFFMDAKEIVLVYAYEYSL